MRCLLPDHRNGPHTKFPTLPSRADIDENAEIARLAALSPLDYDREREDAAKRLGIRVSTLDKSVSQAQPRPEGEKSQGTAFTLEDVAPWTEPVNGERLFHDVRAALGRHVVLNEHQKVAVALWVIHTHAMDKADHSARLHISSPVKRCGKTVLLQTVAALVARTLATENISPAALFRLVEMYQPTMLIDEVDAFMKDNEDIRGLLNAGHARGGQVIRIVGDDHEPRKFSVWGAIALAGIGEIPATVEDRSITIHLRRRRKDESVERLGRNREHLSILARRIARWVADQASQFSDDPALPDELNDRAQDNWRPLVAIADTISQAAGQRAREAACALEGETLNDTDEAGVMLLADVFSVFVQASQQSVLSADYIADKLIKMPDRPWAEWKRGTPLTKHSIARLLKPFGIRSKQTKTFNAKGYDRASVVEAYMRYCAEAPEEMIDAVVNDPF